MLKRIKEIEDFIKSYSNKRNLGLKVKSEVFINEIIIYLNHEKIIYDIDTIIEHEEFYKKYYEMVDQFESQEKRVIYLQYNFEEYFIEKTITPDYINEESKINNYKCSVENILLKSLNYVNINNLEISNKTIQLNKEIYSYNKKHETYYDERRMVA